MMNRIKIAVQAVLWFVLWFAVGGVLLAPLLFGQGTPADTADHRCVWFRLDTLSYANGYGQKRNLANAAKPCADRWLARVRTPVRVDTVRVVSTRTDTLRIVTTRTDTLRITVIRVDTLRRVDTVFVTTIPNTRPTAALSASCDPTTMRCAVNGSASTDNVGVTSYQWNWGDGSVASSGVTSTHQYVAGTYTIRLIVKDVAGLADTATKSVTLATPPPPPDTLPPPPPPDTTTLAKRATLPLVTPNPVRPTPLRSYRIGTNLQAALDTAKAGDELLLSGTTTVNAIWTKCPTAYVTLASAATTLPPAGTRIRPSDAALLPRIQSTNTEPALRTGPGACKLWLRGLDLYGALTGTATVSYGILKLGAGGDEGQTTMASVPNDFVIERSWIHGAPTHNDTRCVVLNSGSTTIRDSWISDCHAVGFDAQAVEGWNGPGPYLIENNYLEGSGENVMFGGADPGILNLSPSDITIRRNHIAKPLSWRTAGWSIKNLVELKNARRVLYEANVLENSWPSSQQGMAVVFKSSQDNCGTCLWEGTQDVTFRWNRVSNAAIGLNLQGYDESGQVKTTTHTARVTVENNLFDNIGTEGAAQLAFLSHDLADIIINSNTFRHAPTVGTSRGSFITMDYGNGAARRLSITNNNGDSGAYGVFYSGGNVGTAALTQMAGPYWSFTGNVLVGGASLASRFPGGNFFPSTAPATPGVDQAELQRRTAGVVVVP